MDKLTAEVINFFKKQGCVVVSTINQNGDIHCAVKGIVGFEGDRIFLLDLYSGRTINNLKTAPKVTVTAFNEHEFEGYTIIGDAKLLEENELNEKIVNDWKDKIVKRITNRILNNMSSGKRSSGHQPEANLPHPKHLIQVCVREIAELTPKPLKR